MTGDNGLLTKAGEAKNSSDIEKEKEKVLLAYNSTYILNRPVTKNLLKTALINDNPDYEIEVYKAEEDLFVFYKNSNRYYKIDMKGEVSGPVEVTKVEDLKPGNYWTDNKGNNLDGNTEATAYQINCIEDLCALSDASKSNGFDKKYFKLMTNLDFENDFSYVDGKILNCNNVEELMNLLTNKDGTGFIPIASNTNYPFAGIFDGNNKRIDNLYINNTDLSAVGLFSRCKTNFTNDEVEMKNLTISGNIISKKSDDLGGIGGFIGLLWYSNIYNINNCKNYCDVTGYSHTGGIYGQNKGPTVKVDRCANYGTIRGGWDLGGISGFVYIGGGSFINCMNNGDVISNSRAGGIVGYEGQKIDVKNSYNLGNISGNEAGGIVGNDGCWSPNMNIINCYNTGVISGISNKIGGITGNGYGTMSIKNSFILSIKNYNTKVNSGATTVTEDDFKNGIVLNNLNTYINYNEDGIDTSDWLYWTKGNNGKPAFVHNGN